MLLSSAVDKRSGRDRACARSRRTLSPFVSSFARLFVVGSGGGGRPICEFIVLLGELERKRPDASEATQARPMDLDPPRSTSPRFLRSL